MEKQVIIIPIDTDLDPSCLLDMAIEISQKLVDDIGSYGEDAEVDEAEIVVMQRNDNESR